MKEMIELLSKSKLFFNIEQQKIRGILPVLSGSVKQFLKGEILIREDDLVDSIGIILSGQLCVTKLFADGSQAYIQKLLPPNIVGIDIVCTRSKISPFFISALENTSVFFIPYDNIFQSPKLEGEIYLAIMNNILTLMSHENMRKSYKLEILSHNSLRKRIVTYFSIQQKKKKSTTFTIPFNREQLAEYLCVNRSALSHELALMEQEGLITFHKNQFTILKIW